MQHPASTDVNQFLEYSSLDESSNLEELLSNQFTLTKLFALLRTWTSTVHKHFARLIFSTLENEVDIDGYDAVTGMNLLHFTCKFGAKQIGHEDQAMKVMNVLIGKGINLTNQCRYIRMNCLHYCAFFDSPSICELLLRHSTVSALLNQSCSSLNNDTPLHLACSALALPTVQALLKAGANKQICNDQQRMPADCIPTTNRKDQKTIADTLRALLHRRKSPEEKEEAEEEEREPQSILLDSIISNLDNQIAASFQMGERVRLANNKVGTIRYFGNVPFGVNLWYGIELEEPTGKHDGCVGGMRYFTCPPNRGIFVQASSVQKISPIPQSPERERRFRPINFPMPNTSLVSSRVDTGLKRDSSVEGRSIEQFQVNDRVSLPKNRYGTVKYVGPTPLGPGTWCGVELDAPEGLHDGCMSVDGQRYFTCKPQHGVFVRSQVLRKLSSNGRRTASLDRQSKQSSRMTTSECDNTLINSTMVDDETFTKSLDPSIQSMTFHVGDRVYYQNHTATVRYIGTTLFAEGIWIGIEYASRALGKNDGTVGGHTYFQCKSNHGLFIRPNRIALTRK